MRACVCVLLLLLLLLLLTGCGYAVGVGGWRINMAVVLCAAMLLFKCLLLLLFVLFCGFCPVEYIRAGLCKAL